MIPALLISVESFVIAIMFFFAYNPKEYFIRELSDTSTMVETCYGSPLKPYSGGFLGVIALLEALFIWDLIANTIRAFKLLPSLLRSGNWGRSQVRLEPQG
jgi:hypothetical protein